MNDLMCGVGIRQSWQVCIWYNSHHKNMNLKLLVDIAP